MLTCEDNTVVKGMESLLGSCFSLAARELNLLRLVSSATYVQPPVSAQFASVAKKTQKKKSIERQNLAQLANVTGAWAASVLETCNVALPVHVL